MGFDNRIKVLIVDDSAVVRQVLHNILSRHKRIQVVGSAPDPYIARDKIVELKPDVITLDIEMPRMDGLTFLKKLMQHFPIPVVVVSSLTPKGSDMALDALSFGAVDVINKPGAAYTVEEVAPRIIESILGAARTDVNKIRVYKSEEQREDSSKYALKKTTNKVVAVGASTGGTVALESMLNGFGTNIPGMIVVQHMPAGFTKKFAERLDSVFQFRVKEAEDGDTIHSGQVLITPGNYHSIVLRSGAKYYVKLKQTPPVFHQRPSVAVMFNSVAKYVGRNAVGVMLTGMGKDGAEAMLTMHKNGSFNIVQDEKTSAVWGMPGAAAELGAGDEILPLDAIAARVLQLAYE